MRSTIGVSVLFTDLVDSTALYARLGAIGADDLRRVHFALLRDAVEEHGGHEVKTLGDGIMAVYSGVGPALDSAIAIQRAAARRNSASEDRALFLRIGIAAGDCFQESGDYFGEPVVQAARLCAFARGGQILASETVRSMAPRGRHDLVAVGDLVLKGLPEPISTVEVQWARGDSELQDAAAKVVPPPEVPLPERLCVRPQFGVVGRAPEWKVLQTALEAANSGDRRIVLMSAEAGMGKTCLATELALSAFARGFLVLYGRCDEEVSVPYRPWVEAFTHYVGHAGAAAWASVSRRVLADFAVLAPSIRDHLAVPSFEPHGSSEADQFGLYAAAASVLRDLTSTRTVVLILDDLHWADRGSLKLLQHVVEAMTSSRLLIVGNYRGTDIGADDPLTATLAALRREPGVERLDLGGLVDADVVTMMETVAGYAMDSDGVELARALREETSGNPFFVGEMLRHLAESGIIARGDDGRWVATIDLPEIGLPQSVREVVGERVRRLGEDAHRVLAAGAVVGRDFDLDVVAGTIDRDPESTLVLLEKATAAGLVTEVASTSDRFSFTHALVQHTLYLDLPHSRRVRLHRTVAETIEALAGERLDEYVPQLANHWLAATRPIDVEKAIAYAVRAGDQALESRAPEVAARWYHQALDVMSDVEEPPRVDVMVRLGEAELRAGEAEHRETLLRAAEMAQRIGATDLLVRAALANNRGWHSRTGVADFDRIAVLEAAATAESTESASRALLLALLAVEYSSAGDDVLERRLALADESVAIRAPSRRSRDAGACSRCWRVFGMDPRAHATAHRMGRRSGSHRGGRW